MIEIRRSNSRHEKLIYVYHRNELVFAACAVEGSAAFSEGGCTCECSVDGISTPAEGPEGSLLDRVAFAERNAGLAGVCGVLWGS